MEDATSTYRKTIQRYNNIRYVPFKITKLNLIYLLHGPRRRFKEVANLRFGEAPVHIFAVESTLMELARTVLHTFILSVSIRSQFPSHTPNRFDMQCVK